MTRPDTPEILIPAIAANAGAIARLDAAAKKRPLTAKQRASRASAVAKLNDYVRRYIALTGGGASIPTLGPSAPDPSLSPADRNRAWDHRIATDYISGTLQRLAANGIDDDDVEGQVAALGPGLTGQALCLGVFGPPDGVYASRVDWSLAEPWGGYWKVSAGYDERGNWAQAWNASQKAGDIVIDPVSPPNAQDVGRANGLNAELDGPA